MLGVTLERQFYFFYLEGGTTLQLKGNNRGHLSPAIWESPQAAVGTEANVTCA